MQGNLRDLYLYYSVIPSNITSNITYSSMPFRAGVSNIIK